VTLRLMQEQGFSRMSIDAVAAEAGVGKPTIYRRWTSKEDLATAALEQLRVDEPPLTGTTALERLKAVLLNFRRSLLRPNGMALIGMVLAEEQHTPELLRLFRERVVAPRRAIVAAAVEDAIRRRELQPDADAEAITTMLIGSIYARYLAGQPIPPAWVDRIVSQLPRNGLTLV